MPRYFFDLRGFHHERDDDGIICANLQDAVRQAKQLLPVIASSEVPEDGEQYSATVLITDEGGQPIYSGAMSYIGSWLIR